VKLGFWGDRSDYNLGAPGGSDLKVCGEHGNASIFGGMGGTRPIGREKVMAHGRVKMTGTVQQPKQQRN